MHVEEEEEMLAYLEAVKGEFTQEVMDPVLLLETQSRDWAP